MSTIDSDQRKPLLGICSFCKGEFAKGDMTRHIKTCKKRGDLIAPETLFPKEEHVRLLQLLIEGKYNPQYWMQIELPETATLDTLDQFLRDIWLECCGHLSSFTIGETTYGIDESPFGGFFEEVDKVKDGEETSLDVSLSQALKARKNFSYEYDFGSTTPLQLKVVSSRKGIWRSHPDGVEVLARNVAPIVVCKVCGKPAKLVAPGGFYDVEEHAYCKKCARIDEDFEPEEMLPVVNSPRVGICAYGA